MRHLRLFTGFFWRASVGMAGGLLLGWLLYVLSHEVFR